MTLLCKTTFYFDPTKKGSQIKLSNQNLTATKNGDSNYHTVLGNIEFNNGRHYWEIKLDKYVDEDDIFIGVAKPDIELSV